MFAAMIGTPWYSVPECRKRNSREMSTSARDGSVERLGRISTSLKSSLTSCSMRMAASASSPAKKRRPRTRDSGVDRLYAPSARPLWLSWRSPARPCLRSATSSIATAPGPRPSSTRDPGFFRRLAAQQAPRYLWIGCSDSRVPANEIVDLAPGRAVRAPERRQRRRAHRLQLPRGAPVRGRRAEGRARHRRRPLRLRRHQGGAGGFGARPHRQLAAPRAGRRSRHRTLEARRRTRARVDRLCELNVIEQVVHLARTTIVQEAWQRGQSLTLHGFIYGLNDGLLNDLAIEARLDAGTRERTTRRPLARLGAGEKHWSHPDEAISLSRRPRARSAGARPCTWPLSRRTIPPADQA